MVAMGGGPEAPQRGNEQKRELLLCVQPHPESGAATVIEEIKKEFPNLEVQFHHNEERSGFKGDSMNIPEGRLIRLAGVISYNTRHVPAFTRRHCRADVHSILTWSQSSHYGEFRQTHTQ
jgi:hypothetical protein